MRPSKKFSGCMPYYYYLVEMSDIEEFNDDFNNIIHINIKQFKTRKFATTVSGIPEEFDYPKILRFWKKTFNCNGRIEEKDKVKNKDKTK